MSNFKCPHFLNKAKRLFFFLDGVTAHRYGGQILYRNFNPRAPCGARPEAYRMGFIDGLISIHAPRAGRGRISFSSRLPATYFNPRARAGRGAVNFLHLKRHFHFNPRARAGRGARTFPPGFRRKYFNPRARAGRGVKANKNPLSALYNYNKKTPVFQQ